MTIDAIIIIVFLISNLFIGAISSFKVKNLKEYVIGNRNVSDIILSITVMATLIGGGSSLGTATEVYKYGIIVIVAKYGVSLGMLIIAFFIAPKLEKFFGFLTVGEIMGKFYGQNARIITGISGALLCTGRMAAQILAFGYISSYFFNVDEKTAILIGSIIIVAYSSFGGIKAVMYTDVLQFMVIIITIPIILNIGIHKVGGYSALIDSLPLDKKTIYPNTEMFRKYFFVFIYMALPLLTPPFVQRMLMAGNVKQIRKSFISTAIIDCIFTTIVGLIGLITFKLYPGINPNHSFLELINNLTPVGIKGLLIIGLFSILMSTADAYLNMLSVCLINDVAKPLGLKFLIRNELLSTKLLTLVSGGIAVLLALYFKNIFELAIYSTNFWAPIIVAPLLLGLFGVKGTNKSFLIGVVCGLITFTFWEIFELKEKTYIYSIIPSVLTNMAGCLLYSIKGNNNEDLALKDKISHISYSFKLKIKSFLGYILNINIVKFCDYHSEKDSMPYQTFAMFMLINQIARYFLSFDNIETINIVLTVISGLLCVFLLLREKLTLKLQKYESIFWYSSVAFSLIIAPVYNLYSYNFNLNSLIVFLLSLFVLSVIVNWIMYLILINIGLISTLITILLFPNNNIIQINTEGLRWFVYVLIFTSFLSLFFKRRNEETDQEKLLIAKNIGGVITHELKTPLLRIYSINRKLKMNNSEQNNIDIINIIHGEFQKSIQYIGNLIEMIGYKLRGADVITEFEELDINQLLNDVILNYPFQYDEDYKKVHIDIPSDFNLFVDKQLFFHVIYNLLNNALHNMKNNSNGMIKISTESTSIHNVIYVEDNGPGIFPGDEEKIFRSYYSTKRNGTGLGLYFCKQAMKKHKGDIKCESRYGVYTRFVLFFPKISKYERIE